MSSWVAGEDVRYLEFFRLRALRERYRLNLERSLLATDMAPYLAAQEAFAALIRDARQRELPPEQEYPDSRVVVNQNLW